MARSRQTRQKEALCAALPGMHPFFTAEELSYKALVPLPTVYRFLRGQDLHSFRCDRRTVYAREQESHCHFPCQRCGTVTHFQLRDISQLKPFGEVCHFLLDVHGVCERCRRPNNGSGV